MSKDYNRAIKLIKNGNYNDALTLCKDLVQISPDNFNYLLLTSKCYIELDCNICEAKELLEKALKINNDNKNAIQGLKKLFLKYFENFIISGIDFFHALEDIELNEEIQNVVISNRRNLVELTDGKDLLTRCLRLKLQGSDNLEPITIFSYLVLEEYILRKDKALFSEWQQELKKLDNVIGVREYNELDCLKHLILLCDELAEPEVLDEFIQERNLNNVYGNILLAKMKLIYYETDECEETCQLALSMLQKTDVLNEKKLKVLLLNIRLQNAVYKREPDVVKSILEQIKFEQLSEQEEPIQQMWEDISLYNRYLVKFMCGQDEEVGVNGDTIITSRADNKVMEWEDAISDTWQLVCDWIEGREETELRIKERVEEILKKSELNSFELFVLAKVLQSKGMWETSFNVALDGLDRNKHNDNVYCWNNEVLADVFERRGSDGNSDKEVISCLENILESVYSFPVLERVLNIYADKGRHKDVITLVNEIGLLNEDSLNEGNGLTTSSVPDWLLIKYATAAAYCGMISLAICVIQRLIKSKWNQPGYWQLLGDLYAQRGNVGCACKAFQKALALEEEGNSCQILIRLGNIYSIKYQESLDECDYTDAVHYFDRAMQLKSTSDDAIQLVKCRALLCYLRATICLNRLMLKCAATYIQEIIDMLTRSNQLTEMRFAWILMGKAVLLSILGRIDHLLNLDELNICLKLENNAGANPIKTAERCFQKNLHSSTTEGSITGGSHLGLAMLYLHCLNENQVVEASSNTNVSYQAEQHFRQALYHLMPLLFVDRNVADDTNTAWKYLGLLMLKFHSKKTEKIALDIQHCLLSATIGVENMNKPYDSIADPEAAYYLGMHYLQQNEYVSASDMFKKLQIDYPLSPIGYIGMSILNSLGSGGTLLYDNVCGGYLKSSNKSTLSDSNIIKALFCYNNKDEATLLDDSYHEFRMEMLIPQFILPQLITAVFSIYSGISSVHSICSYNIHHTIEALRSSLQLAWTKYQVYEQIEYQFSDSTKEYYETIGCLLAVLERARGIYPSEKMLNLCAKNKAFWSNRFAVMCHIEKLWTEDINDQVPKLNELMNSSFMRESLYDSDESQLINQSDIKLVDDFKLPPEKLIFRRFEYRLLEALCSFLKQDFEQLFSCLKVIFKNISLIFESAFITYVARDKLILFVTGMLITAIMSINRFNEQDTVFGMCNCWVNGLANGTWGNYRIEVTANEQLARIYSQLLVLLTETIGKSDLNAFSFIHDRCIRQPRLAERWMTLLEYSMKNCDMNSQIRILIRTNRPWTMALCDYDRYSSLLQTHIVRLKSPNSTEFDVWKREMYRNHRAMLIRAAALFPDRCLSLLLACGK